MMARDHTKIIRVSKDAMVFSALGCINGGVTGVALGRIPQPLYRVAQGPLENEGQMTEALGRFSCDRVIFLRCDRAAAILPTLLIDGALWRVAGSVVLWGGVFNAWF
jgi:hypothetical protein